MTHHDIYVDIQLLYTQEGCLKTFYIKKMSDKAANQRIAKNTLFLYLRMSIVLVVSLYTTRIILNSLGVEDYGIYNVVCGFIAMFGFLNSTLSTSTNRFYNYEIGQGNEDGIKKVYSNSLIIQGALAFFVLFLVEIVGLWYLNNYMVISSDRLAIANWIFQFSLISMLFTFLQTPYIASILAYERMNYYAVVSIIDVFLKLAIAISLPFFGVDKLFIYGFLIMLISLVNFVLYGVYAIRQFDSMKFSRQIDKALFKKMLMFTGWTFLNPLAYTGRSHGCNLVLNFFFGPIINAAYAITNQVSAAIDSFSMSVSVAARPQIIQSYSCNDYGRTNNLFFSTSKIMFVLIAILTIPLSFNMEFILNVWLGDNVPEYTVIFCIWILMVKLIDSLNPSCTNLIMATGKIKAYMIVSSLLIFSVVPFSIVFFNICPEPFLMFFIMLLCTVANQVFSVIILHRVLNHISLMKYLKEIVVPSLILLVISISVIYYRHSFLHVHPICSILLDFLIILTCSAIVLWAFLNNKEKQFILNFFIKKAT